MKRWFTLLVLLSFCGFALPAAAESDEVARAYKDFRKKRYERAANRFWEILKTAEEGSEDFETANYFIGQSLYKLGFRYGGTEYFYQIVRFAGNTEYIGNSIETLRDLIENYPNDSRLIVEDLFFSVELSFLDAANADFVEFYQGLHNKRHGFERWAKQHFDRIHPESPYHYRVRYIEAVELLRKGKTEEAQTILQEIIDAKFDDHDVKGRARQTKARLFYERKKYPEALEVYNAVDSPLPEQASVFMEKGWTQYFMKNYELALGAVHAVGAPIYSGYFDAEKFIIQMLVYKDLCMYPAAGLTLENYQKQYGPAVKMIKNRDDLTQSEKLLNALFWSEGVKQRYDFLQSVNDELERLRGRKAWRDSGLREHLVNLYELKQKEMAQSIKAEVYDGLEVVSEKLLEEDEQVNLLTYEVKLDELKRAKVFQSLELAEEEKLPMTHGDRIYWPYDGEYWTDEMHDFKFLVRDECKALMVR